MSRTNVKLHNPEQPKTVLSRDPNYEESDRYLRAAVTESITICISITPSFRQVVHNNTRRDLKHCTLSAIMIFSESGFP